MQQKMARCFRHFATMLFLSGFALLSATQVNCASAASAADSSSTAKNTSLSVKTAAAPRPSKKWLRGAKSAKGKHQVTVDRFDRDRGLLASYEAPNGERLLFRAAYVAPNIPYAEILYFDDETNKVERLFPMVSPQEKTGKKKGALSVQEVISTLHQLAGKRPDDAHAQEASKRWTKFSQSELARTAEDGIVALYAALDGQPKDQELDALRKPLGAFAMALQFGAGPNAARTPLQLLVEPTRLTELRPRCRENDCAARGNGFELNEDGLLNVVGRSTPSLNGHGVKAMPSLSEKLGASVGHGRSLSRFAGGSLIASPLDTPTNCNNRAGPECFGNCGVDCPFPSQVGVVSAIVSDVCYGHDYCVCLHGHAACLASTPPGCTTNRQGVPCSSLAEAVADVLQRVVVTIFSDMAELIDTMFGITIDIVGTAVQLAGDAFATIVNALSEFLDWFFGEVDCDDEENLSTETC